MSLSKRELFQIWRAESNLTKKNAAVLAYAMQKLGLTDNEDDPNYLCYKKIIQNFTGKIAQKWKNCSRSPSIFEEKYREWLDEAILLEVAQSDTESSSRKKGRPPKSFSDVGDQSKRQKIAPLLERFSTEELSFATSKSLYKSGKRYAALMVQKVASGSSEAATSFKHASSSSARPLVKYTPEEALALFVDGRLTKHTYMLLRLGAKERNSDIYPSYHKIQEAKEDCYPKKENISISETSAEVKLQALVDHTCSRLVSVQEGVLTQNIGLLSNGITMVYKWGCDGSAGHSTYKQSFSGESSQTQTDAFLFAVCLVPLRLQVTNDNTILWNNPCPSSTRFCRPIKIVYEKESSSLSKKEIENVQNQINQIMPTTLLIANKEVVINHLFKLTMIDGKMFGVITESSSQICAICGATPKNMNNIEKILKRIPNRKHLDFGMSTLHAWIRCFEALLHISYRLELQKWQIRDDSEKIQFNHRKEMIRDRLKSQMGLLVDIPKPGFGTTNDGNSARRFFEQPSLASSITGIDEDLIYRFSVILKSISCGYAINVDAFRKYSMDTAQKYIQLYSWYYMPSTIHKILIHGADIISAAGMPIGMLSEEAIESRNKDFKNFREFYSRKMSRYVTMQDLFNRLLFSSDPKISLLSKCRSRKLQNLKSLDRNVVSLLAEPVVNSKVDLFEDDDSDNKPEHDSDSD